MMSPKYLLSCAILFFTLGFAVARGEQLATSTGWKALQASGKLEIAETTLAVDGKEIPAVTVRIPASQSSFNTALVIPIEEGAKGPAQSVSFRVKVPEGAPRAMTVALFGKSWYLKTVDGDALPVKRFTEASPEYDGDELKVTWEIGPILASAEDIGIRQIILIYPTNELPEGTVVTLTLSEATFE